MNPDTLARRLDRIGRSRPVKAPPDPTELDRLEAIVLSYQQGLDARKARALLRRMHS